MTRRTITTTVLFLQAAADNEATWQPCADIYRSAQGWLIKLDLAGVRREDVSIEISGTRLTVRGCRRDLLAGHDWNPYSMEIAYTRFERSLELGGGLQHAQIDVEMSDGMLLIYVIPKEGDDE